ncbi:sensor histidine kinase [Candidatus Pelagibacter communis]|uniref:sensor histidine kinase n=1 Tax=Pelagibacter ubique TaxID=198252 RepID=UPI00094C8AA2|nr:HAMP domain-containing sensor histidine kinase [Candidatus Pelagibacter ubique]
MFSSLIKNLSILKKFLFINLLIFIFIGTLTIIYLNYVQPNLIKKKTSLQIEVINNTINNLNRLNVEFEKNEVKKFLLSTRFLFQNLDRVVFFNDSFEILADTDTLDLDPRSFSSRIEIVEFDLLNNQDKEKTTEELIDTKKNDEFEKRLQEYSVSDDYGKPVTFTNETYNKFKLSTIKNVLIDDENVGYIFITQNANDVKTAINERKTFVIRTAILIAIVIFIFSLVLNRYFLKPIKNLVNYTENIKEKSKKKIDIKSLIKRNDELGTLSLSLDEMTNELQKRVNTAENFSTDLVHEIRNPLASLKSASEILEVTNNNVEKEKLTKILTHDVERIERLITDYSQMLKDEVAITKESMKILDLKKIADSVVDDFNAIYNTKRGINIDLQFKNSGEKFNIKGIENRIEQVLANLLENSISFSKDNQNIVVKLSQKKDGKISLSVIDEGIGFKEKNTDKIFKRFYSNRPDKFGEHSGLGLNIVKNLVDLHGGQVIASNNVNKKGAKVEIIFPKLN